MEIHKNFNATYSRFYLILNISQFVSIDRHRNVQEKVAVVNGLQAQHYVQLLQLLL